MFNVIRRGNFILGPYCFESGTPFNPPPLAAPFVPDRNFDGDAIYGLSDWTTPETEASEHPTSLAPSDSELITSMAPAAPAMPSPAKT
jgi:hypothetical protein